MGTGEDAATRPFFTKGMSLVILAVTFGGLLNAATRPESVSGSRLAIVLLLGVIHALLGTAGLSMLERRGLRAYLPIYFAFALLITTTVVVLSDGLAAVLMMTLIGESVLYLSRRGTALIVAVCAVTRFALLASEVPASEASRSFVRWCGAITFVIIFSQLLSSQQRARAEVERLAKEMSEANERLRQYAKDATMLSAAQERNRIAREIHDGLGHYLTVVHVQIDAARATLELDPDKARRALEKAQKLTHEGLSDVRRSVSLLRGSAPATRPIVAALEKLAGECTADGPKATLTVWGSSRPLSEAIELTLYRATQEALTNVRRHARASKVSIDLTFTPDDSVRLRIEDDGIGGEDPRDGFGLLGLRERVALVGGNVDIRTTRGLGFSLEMEIPV